MNSLDNAAIAFDSALQSPGQLDWTFIQMKKARSLALSGNTTEALAYYDQIYTQTENDFTRALIDLRKGQIYTSLGMEEEAHIVPGCRKQLSFCI